MLPVLDGQENNWQREKRVSVLSRVLPGVAHRDALKEAEIQIAALQEKHAYPRFTLEEEAAREAMEQIGEESLSDPKERRRYLDLKAQILYDKKKY